MARLVVPVVLAGGKYRVYPHFARAPAFAMIDVSPDGTYTMELVENPVAGGGEGGGRGRYVKNLILSKRPDVLIATSVGPGVYYDFLESGVKIMKPTKKDIEGVIEDFLAGRLKPLEGPVER